MGNSCIQKEIGEEQISSLPNFSFGDGFISEFIDSDTLIKEQIKQVNHLKEWKIKKHTGKMFGFRARNKDHFKEQAYTDLKECYECQFSQKLSNNFASMDDDFPIRNVPDTYPVSFSKNISFKRLVVMFQYMSHLQKNVVGCQGNQIDSLLAKASVLDDDNNRQILADIYSEIMVVLLKQSLNSVGNEKDLMEVISKLEQVFNRWKKSRCIVDFTNIDDTSEMYAYDKLIEMLIEVSMNFFTKNELIARKSFELAQNITLLTGDVVQCVRLISILQKEEYHFVPSKNCVDFVKNFGVEDSTNEIIEFVKESTTGAVIDLSEIKGTKIEFKKDNLVDPNQIEGVDLVTYDKFSCEGFPCDMQFYMFENKQFVYIVANQVVLEVQIVKNRFIVRKINKLDDDCGYANKLFYYEFYCYESEKKDEEEPKKDDEEAKKEQVENQVFSSDEAKTEKKNLQESKVCESVVKMETVDEQETMLETQVTKENADDACDDIKSKEETATKKRVLKKRLFIYEESQFSADSHYLNLFALDSDTLKTIKNESENKIDNESCLKIKLPSHFTEKLVDLEKVPLVYRNLISETSRSEGKSLSYHSRFFKNKDGEVKCLCSWKSSNYDHEPVYTIVTFEYDENTCCLRAANQGIIWLDCDLDKNVDSNDAFEDANRIKWNFLEDFSYKNYRVCESFDKYYIYSDSVKILINTKTFKVEYANTNKYLSLTYDTTCYNFYKDQIYILNKGEINTRKLVKKVPFVVESEFPELEKYKKEVLNNNQNEEKTENKDSAEETTDKKRNFLLQLGLIEDDFKDNKKESQQKGTDKKDSQTFEILKTIHKFMQDYNEKKLIGDLKSDVYKLKYPLLLNMSVKFVDSLLCQLDDLIDQKGDNDQQNIYTIKIVIDLLELQLSNYWENEGDLEEFINFSNTVYDKTNKILKKLLNSKKYLNNENNLIKSIADKVKMIDFFTQGQDIDDDTNTDHSKNNPIYKAAITLHALYNTKDGTNLLKRSNMLIKKVVRFMEMKEMTRVDFEYGVNKFFEVMEKIMINKITEFSTTNNDDDLLDLKVSFINKIFFETIINFVNELKVSDEASAQTDKQIISEKLGIVGTQFSRCIRKSLKHFLKVDIQNCSKEKLSEFMNTSLLQPLYLLTQQLLDQDSEIVNQIVSIEIISTYRTLIKIASFIKDKLETGMNPKNTIDWDDQSEDLKVTRDEIFPISKTYYFKGCSYIKLEIDKASMLEQKEIITVTGFKKFVVKDEIFYQPVLLETIGFYDLVCANHGKDNNVFKLKVVSDKIKVSVMQTPDTDVYSRKEADQSVDIKINAYYPYIVKGNLINSLLDNLGLLVAKTMKYFLHNVSYTYYDLLSNSKRKGIDNQTEENPADKSSQFNKEALQKVLNNDFFNEGVDNNQLKKQYYNNKLVPLLSKVQKKYKSLLKNVKDEIQKTYSSEMWDVVNNLNCNNEIKNLDSKIYEVDEEFESNSILNQNFSNVEQLFYNLFFNPQKNKCNEMEADTKAEFATMSKNLKEFIEVLQFKYSKINRFHNIGGDDFLNCVMGIFVVFLKHLNLLDQLKFIQTNEEIFPKNDDCEEKMVELKKTQSQQQSNLTKKKEDFISKITVYCNSEFEMIYEEWQKASKIRMILKSKYCAEEKDKMTHLKRINELSSFLYVTNVSNENLMKAKKEEFSDECDMFLRKKESSLNLNQQMKSGWTDVSNQNEIIQSKQKSSPMVRQNTKYKRQTSGTAEVKKYLDKVEKKRRHLHFSTHTKMHTKHAGDYLSRVTFEILESNLTVENIKLLQVERMLRVEFIAFAIYIFDTLLSLSSKHNYIGAEFILNGFHETFRVNEKVCYLIDDLSGIGETNYEYLNKKTTSFISNLVGCFKDSKDYNIMMSSLDCQKWWFRGKDFPCVEKIDIISMNDSLQSLYDFNNLAEKEFSEKATNKNNLQYSLIEVSQILIKVSSKMICEIESNAQPGQKCISEDFSPEIHSKKAENAMSSSQINIINFYLKEIQVQLNFHSSIVPFSKKDYELLKSINEHLILHSKDSNWNNLFHSYDRRDYFAGDDKEVHTAKHSWTNSCFSQSDSSENSYPSGEDEDLESYNSVQSETNRDSNNVTVNLSIKSNKSSDGSDSESNKSSDGSDSESHTATDKSLTINESISNSDESKSVQENEDDFKSSSGKVLLIILNSYC